MSGFVVPYYFPFDINVLSAGGTSDFNVITQNKVSNGGTPETTDWVDSNGDGVANTWVTFSIYPTIPSIVTGNGFTGNAQRVAENNAGDYAILYQTSSFVSGSTYKISFKYRSNRSVYFNRASGVNYLNWPANTSNATTASGYFSADTPSWYIGAYGVSGSWIELDEVKIVLNDVSESFYATSSQQFYLQTNVISNGILGFETQYALDTDKNSYMLVDTGSSNSLTIGYITSSLPTEFSEYYPCCYMRSTTVGGNNVKLQYSNDSSSFSDYTISTLYGDGVNSGSYIGFTSGSEVESIAIFNQKNLYKYFKFYIQNSLNNNNKLQSMMNGLYITLPDSAEDYDVDYTYHGHEVTKTQFGNVRFSGWQNSGNRRKKAMKFEYITATQKDMLVKIFELSKGGLPLLYVDDETNNSTWMQCYMGTLTVTEPIAEAFSVTFDLEEY